MRMRFSRISPFGAGWTVLVGPLAYLPMTWLEAQSPGPASRHYREVAAVGLPVVASNDPMESTVDLTTELLARIAETDGVVAVRETDVSRLHRVREICPHLNVLARADNAMLELTVCGATVDRALPERAARLCLRLHRLCVARDLAVALPLYAQLYHLFSWDSRPEVVQAVKLAMRAADG
jgi:4-hydroxy-tetrahydrodipicolinate synthase